MAYHCKLREGLRDDHPAPGLRTRILSTARSAYESAEWYLPDDFLQFSHFERVLAKLDWTSSPGYPYMRRATNNRQLFKVADDGTIDQDRKLWMWDIVSQRIKNRTSDPIRLFIKPEPLKKKKLEQHRYRLISSVSVADQIIDHMLFGDMNDKLIESWPMIPSKPGWSHLIGGWRHVPVEQWVAADKSGWDWTMMLWLIDLVLSLRASLCKNLTPEWLDLARWRYIELFVAPLFIASNGMLLRQKRPGVMKSGCVNTISDNSMMQYLLHLRVCFELGIEPEELWSMGDDTLQKKMQRIKEYFEKLAQYCKLKQWAITNEFAGFRFQGRSVEPLYRGKHAYTLLHMDPAIKDDLADAYMLQYHRSKHRSYLANMFTEMGCKLRSDVEYDLIFDGY